MTIHAAARGENESRTWSLLHPSDHKSAEDGDPCAGIGHTSNRGFVNSLYTGTPVAECWDILSPSPIIEHSRDHTITKEDQEG